MIGLYDGKLPRCFEDDEVLVETWKRVFIIDPESGSERMTTAVESITSALAKVDESKVSSTGFLNFLLLDCYARDGRHHDVIAASNNFERFESRDVEFLVKTTVVHSYQQLGQHEFAVALLSELAELVLSENITPIRWDDTLLEFALIHRFSEQNTAAINALSTIIAERNPGNINLLEAYGRLCDCKLFERLGVHTLITKQLRPLVSDILEQYYSDMLDDARLSLIHPNILLARGSFYQATDKYPASIRDFSRAIEVLDRLRMPWICGSAVAQCFAMRSNSYFVLEDYEAAKKDMQRAKSYFSAFKEFAEELVQ